jgi:hypothetical protein
MSKLTKIEGGLDTTARDGRTEVDAEARPADDRPSVGSWFWVKDDEKKGRKYLMCVIHVGSNYAEMDFPESSSERIHLDEFWERCTPEPNWQAVIDRAVGDLRGDVRRLMGEVHEITARLGVGKRDALPDGNETQALVAHSKGAVEDYQKDLVKAKEKTLPKLFEDIKRTNEQLARWMTAAMTPLKAEAEALSDSLGAIQNRIFAVELYAGLTETVELVQDGAPAPETEPISLLQRRHYMDEECLVAYEAGGMRFGNIGAFDKWLLRPKNLNRILPFKRCVVAFRVRREDSRLGEDSAQSLSDFINLQIERNADKTTFLYLRNGERVYRLNTKIEFDAKLFPDLDRQSLSRKLWAKMFGGNVDTLVTDDHYQEMVRERAEAQERLKHLPKIPGGGIWDTPKMRKKYPDEAEYEKHYSEWKAKQDAHYKRDHERWILSDVGRDLDSYKPYDANHVYYDDISKFIADEMAKHNRLVLVLQGLLDRSPVFHPHPPWQIFTQAGFEQGIKLVFDHDRALVSGDAPDFEAYRRHLNASLKTGSVTVGQDNAWELHEGEKESERRRRDYRHRGDKYFPKRHRPYGDPGPGLVARVEHFSKKNQTCTFRWRKDRKRYDRYNEGDLPASFTCPADNLLNIDGYQPGDFLQFYNDPRTRAEYLRWAPLLLTAEDYKAGKLKLGARRDR